MTNSIPRLQYFLFLLQNFVGNNDRNTTIKNILYEGVLTRYVRFLPTSNHTKVCIRVEIFGVTNKPVMLKGDLVSKPKHAHYGDCGRRDKTLLLPKGQQPWTVSALLGPIMSELADEVWVPT